MKPSPLQVYALKLAVFSAVLLYLVIDLFLWHGPVWRAAYDSDLMQKRPTGVATVYGEDITPAQLRRHTAEQDKLAGRTAPAPELRPSRLMELVRAAELRTRTRYNDLNLPPCKEQAGQEVAKLATRAADDAAFEAQLASQGYTRASFTDKMEARMREQAQLERAIAPFCEVTDEDVAKHYEQLKEELTLPESRPVKHIFLATLHKNPDEVKAVALYLLHRLQTGEDFATVATEASEDERSAPAGGDLGVIYNDGTSPLPKLPLFGKNAIAPGAPALVQSAWGWHILLAGQITPARPLSLEESKESLRTAIISAQRELATQAYFNAALKEDRQHKRVQIHVP